MGDTKAPAAASPASSAELKVGNDPLEAKIHPDFLPFKEDCVRLRRWFHKHPELSLKEEKTAAFIADELKKLGMEVKTHVGGFGVVGLLKGEGGEGRTIGIRADMDGLPIEEQVDEDYKSVNNGVMHACGHDGHMAILLTAAKVLSTKKWKKKMKGCIKFVFQPAEEGFAGAKAMIEDGLLEESPKIEEIYGLHLWNYQQVGIVGVRMGPMMAASDRFYVHVQGKGGHGAVPDGTADAIVASAQLISGLHTIVPRNISPLDPAVVTVGTVNGGWASNVIADKVTVSGTVRTFEKGVQKTIMKRMCAICEGIGTAFDVRANLDYQQGYPCTANRSKTQYDNIVKAAEAVVGKDMVREPRQVMCSEDMSYFLDQVPGCFFFLGSALDMKDIRPHHKSVFDIDERCLAVGASIWVRLVDNLLCTEE